MKQSAADLLLTWLSDRLDQDQINWLTDRIKRIETSNSDRDLHISLGMIPRRLGRQDLALSDHELQQAQAVRSGWNPAAWSIDAAARVLVLCHLAASQGDEFADTLKDLCKTADVAESIAIFQGFAVFPHHATLDQLVGDCLRTNMRAVFESIAHNNPFPKDFFDENRWNHMVLKALFVDSPLYPIQGLDERANPELALILCNYAHERWAAQRPVTAELWRCVGPFASGEMVDDLNRAAASENNTEREAAVLALSQSNDANARSAMETIPRVARKNSQRFAKLGNTYCGNSLMMFIDPHAHMISRTTDDYEAMAESGVVALIEPAFWVGQPRTHVATYMDYLSAIVGFERFRAGQFGIRHYCTIGLNSKEANNEELAEAVMEILPRFALKEGVVAIGEIGYDEQTELEDRYFRQQLELAKELDLPVMIHTPHRDKKRGTTRSMDVCEEHGMDPTKNRR